MTKTFCNYNTSNISDYWISDITERVMNYTHPKLPKNTDIKTTPDLSDNLKD